MDDGEIASMWQQHFPKSRELRTSWQVCTLLCELFTTRARLVIQARTEDERLKTVLEECGVPRSQFDQLAGEAKQAR